MNNLPIARTSEIVVQELKGELLVYDLTIDKAFCLNQTLAIVYEGCDGRHTFDELKAAHKLTDDFIYLALDELKKENLLEENYVSPLAGMNRREMVKRAGLACAAALPVIAGIVAPAAAAAQSESAGACNTTTNCLCTLPIASTDAFCAGLGTCFGAGCVCVLTGDCIPSENNKFCAGTCGVISV